MALPRKPIARKPRDFRHVLVRGATCLQVAPFLIVVWIAAFDQPVVLLPQHPLSLPLSLGMGKFVYLLTAASWLCITYQKPREFGVLYKHAITSCRKLHDLS